MAPENTANDDKPRAVSEVRLLGLEPKTYGLKVQRVTDTSDDCQTSCDARPFDLADCLALLRRESPDLARVVEAWPTLADPIRRAILAMVEASRTS